MEWHSTVVDGALTRWSSAGEGPVTVVFVHGIPTSPVLWRHVTPRVRGARCLAPEMVGYGASIPEGRGRDISVARQADHLVDWLDALHIERAVFVGHDLGGGVAQIAAVRRPERCLGLVLTNAIAYDSWPIPSVRVMRAAGPLLARLPGPAVWPAIASLMIRGHDDRAIARESLRLHWQPYADDRAADALARQVRSLDARDTLAIADRLPRLDVPARVVWGAADQFQKVAYGERLSRDLGTRIRRIEGGRHFTPEDHPQEIADAVMSVVASAGT